MCVHAQDMCACASTAGLSEEKEEKHRCAPQSQAHQTLSSPSVMALFSSSLLQTLVFNSSPPRRTGIRLHQLTQLGTQSAARTRTRIASTYNSLDSLGTAMAWGWTNSDASFPIPSARDNEGLVTTACSYSCVDVCVCVAAVCLACVAGIILLMQSRWQCSDFCSSNNFVGFMMSHWTIVAAQINTFRSQWLYIFTLLWLGKSDQWTQPAKTILETIYLMPLNS